MVIKVNVEQNVEQNVERTGPSQQEELMKAELKERRIEQAKLAGFSGLIVAGGGALNFGEELVKLAGGVIFVGAMLYPLVDMGRDFVKDWKGDDIRAEYEGSSDSEQIEKI